MWILNNCFKFFQNMFQKKKNGQTFLQELLHHPLIISSEGLWAKRNVPRESARRALQSGIYPIQN
jgi:hypothetical protein